MKITCISSLCWIDKPSFPSFSIFNFLLHFRHLSFNDSMNKVIYSQNMTNPLTFLRRILFKSLLFSLIRSRICSLVTFSGHFIFSMLWDPSHPTDATDVALGENIKIHRNVRDLIHRITVFLRI